MTRRDTEGLRRLRTLGVFSLTAICLLPSSSADAPGCDVTWIPFENKWYTFIPAQGNGYKMEKAQEVCKDIGANVVSIHCEKENKFIVHQLKKNVQSETIWLGMVFDIDSDTLTWLDQSAVNYSNWGAGEPAGRFDADICIVMDTKSGQWKTVNCDNDSGRSVMCETTALAIPDREKCTKHGKNLLPTVLVIAFAVILVMISIVSWYAYKKKYLTVNGFTSLLSNTTDRVTNNSVLVENEEREYEA